jgi:hypothetical protein
MCQLLSVHNSYLKSCVKSIKAKLLEHLHCGYQCASALVDPALRKYPLRDERAIVLSPTTEWMIPSLPPLNQPQPDEFACCNE